MEALGYRDFEIEGWLAQQEIRPQEVVPAEPESRAPAPPPSRRRCEFHGRSCTLW
jgi:hypothetical protein